MKYPKHVEKAEKLMKKQTQKNKSPAWQLTRIAVCKGSELAKRHGVDESIVLISLYLSHCVFSPVWKGKVQKNHMKLSADFAKAYIKKWKIDEEDKKIILDSIAKHHDKNFKEKTAEIVRNAKCFKFVTVKGALVFLHELGRRKENYDNAVMMVLKKARQKQRLLSIPDCIKEGNRNVEEIRKMFASDNIK